MKISLANKVYLVTGASGGIGAAMAKAIAQALGSNLGTRVTAMLASIGKMHDAVRAALVHFLFNALGVLIWLFFIPELAQMATYFAQDTTQNHLPRDIANAHTLFNAINLLIFLTFTTFLAKITYQLVPLSEAEKNLSLYKPLNLQDSLLQTPEMALDVLAKEVSHAGQLLANLIRQQHALQKAWSVKMLTNLEVQLKQMAHLLEALLQYARRINIQTLDEAQSKRSEDLLNGIYQLSEILDTAEGFLQEALVRMHEEGVKPSEKTQALLDELNDLITQTITLTAETLEKMDQDQALQVIAYKQRLDAVIEAAFKHQHHHLGDDEKRLVIFRLEMQYVDAYKRFHTLSKRVVRRIVG